MKLTVKKYEVPLIASFATAILFIPFILFAQSTQPLVPCEGANCTFTHLITLVERVINFLLFAFAVPLAAISFAIAGVIILTAGGNETKVEQGKEIIGNVVWGLLIALSAWLVVKAILIGLGVKVSFL